MLATAAIADAHDGTILLPRIAVAPRWSADALRGLLGSDGLGDGEGLLLGDPLGCLHTIGMRFAIDVVFLDRRLRVVRVVSHVAPGRLVLRPGATRQLELAAGAAARRGIVRGRHLALVPRTAREAIAAGVMVDGGTAAASISTGHPPARSAGPRIGPAGLALAAVTCLRWRCGPGAGPPPGAIRRHRRNHDQEGVRRWAPACS